MSRCAMLTTIDNPYNPFDDFDEWLQFDNDKSYNSCGKVDRLAILSDEMSDEEKNEEIERAIDEFIAVDPFDIYIKVVKEDEGEGV